MILDNVPTNTYLHVQDHLSWVGEVNCLLFTRIDTVLGIVDQQPTEAQVVTNEALTFCLLPER